MDIRARLGRIDHDRTVEPELPELLTREQREALCALRCFDVIQKLDQREYRDYSELRDQIQHGFLPGSEFVKQMISTEGAHVDTPHRNPAAFQFLHLTSGPHQEDILEVFRLYGWDGEFLRDLQPDNMMEFLERLLSLKYFEKEVNKKYSVKGSKVGYRSRAWKRFIKSHRGDNSSAINELDRRVGRLEVAGLDNFLQFISSYSDSLKPRHSGEAVATALHRTLRTLPELIECIVGFSTADPASVEGNGGGWLYGDYLNQNETYGCLFDMMMPLLYRKYLKKKEYQPMECPISEERSKSPSLKNLLRSCIPDKEVSMYQIAMEICEDMKAREDISERERDAFLDFSMYRGNLEDHIQDNDMPLNRFEIDMLLTFKALLGSLQEHLWRPDIRDLYIDAEKRHTPELSHKLREMNIDLEQHAELRETALKSKRIVQKLKRWRGLYIYQDVTLIEGNLDGHDLLGRLYSVVDGAYDVRDVAFHVFDMDWDEPYRAWEDRDNLRKYEERFGMNNADRQQHTGNQWHRDVHNGDRNFSNGNREGHRNVNNGNRDLYNSNRNANNVNNGDRDIYNSNGNANNGNRDGRRNANNGNRDFSNGDRSFDNTDRAARNRSGDNNNGERRDGRAVHNATNDFRYVINNDRDNNERIYARDTNNGHRYANNRVNGHRNNPRDNFKGNWDNKYQ